MWEDVSMENAAVGIVAVALLVYLFWTLIGPEQF
jgi:K+-transporting ATPase KdpF subunit